MQLPRLQCFNELGTIFRAYILCVCVCVCVCMCVCVHVCVCVCMCVSSLVSGNTSLPCLNGLSSRLASLATPPSLTRHVWADHTLPVTGLHCGRGGMQCRVFTCSLDQTCKVRRNCLSSVACIISQKYI